MLRAPATRGLSSRRRHGPGRRPHRDRLGQRLHRPGRLPRRPPPRQGPARRPQVDPRLVAAPWADRGVPKSSLDGSRESVIDESIYDAVRSGAESAEWLRKTFHARPAERLSGVDLLKRIGQDRDSAGDDRPAFHSTSHISAGPLRTRVARLGADGQRALDAWYEHLDAALVDRDRFRVATAGAPRAKISGPGAPDLAVPRAGFDGYLSYEDRIPDILSQYRPGSPNENTDSALRQSHATFMRQLGWPRPPMPYYVFLLADGDRMGKAIDAVATPKEHREISKRLDAWAAGCRERVETALGTCIYAGGDDVMALLPLHTALDCARDLAESFRDAMQDAFKHVAPAARPEQSPTLSVGLAIVHHMQPMRDALDLVRDAEKDAKLSRNALAIRLAKRSGGVLSARGGWDEERPLDHRLPEWARIFGGELLPDKAAFALEEAIAPFTDSRLSAPVSADMLRSLARRALGRRRAQHGQDTIDDQLRERLDDRIKDNDPAKAIRELSQELQISRLFLDAYQEAWGDAFRTEDPS